MKESGRKPNCGRRSFDPKKARKELDTEFEIRYSAEMYMKVEKELHSLRRSYIKGEITKEQYISYRKEIINFAS